jgi:hypothetical protein
MQHHTQRLYQRRQLRRVRTAERLDSRAVGPDGVCDLVRLGLASLRVTAQILGKLGEASRVQVCRSCSTVARRS